MRVRFAGSFTLNAALQSTGRQAPRGWGNSEAAAPDRPCVCKRTNPAARRQCPRRHTERNGVSGGERPRGREPQDAHGTQAGSKQDETSHALNIGAVVAFTGNGACLTAVRVAVSGGVCAHPYSLVMATAIRYDQPRTFIDADAQLALIHRDEHGGARRAGGDWERYTHEGFVAAYPTLRQALEAGNLTAADAATRRQLTSRITLEELAASARRAKGPAGRAIGQR